MNTSLTFRHGKLQATAPLHLTFQKSSAFSEKRVDQWIEQALNFNPNGYHNIYLKENFRATSESIFLDKLLLISNLLLQEIRIPVFDGSIVQSIEKSPVAPDTFTAHVYYPAINEIPKSCMSGCLNLAADLIHKISIETPDLEQSYQAITDQWVKPWLQKIPGGRSTISVLQVAHELGIPFVHYGSGRYILGWGSQSRFFDRTSNNKDSAIGAHSAQNKSTAIQMMRKAGIPVPKGILLSKMSFSDSEIKKLNLPLIVKPVDSSLGRGISPNIMNLSDVKVAFEKACQFSNGVLVEEYKRGTCYRIQVVEGRVILVVKRNPRCVVGDGKNSIEALVADENTRLRNKFPTRRQPVCLIDNASIEFLKTKGLSPQSIPAEGVKVPLRDLESGEFGGDPEVVTSDLHPDNAELALRAANLFGLSCAGVDFISEDISIPWHNNDAVINEVNYAPLLGRNRDFSLNAIKTYLKFIFPNQGRIPIDIYIGHDLKSAAIKRKSKLAVEGLRCYVCIDDRISNPDGNPVHFASGSNFIEWINMLQSRNDLDALVLHLNDVDAFAEIGFPFPYINSLEISPNLLQNESTLPVIKTLKSMQSKNRKN